MLYLQAFKKYFHKYYRKEMLREIIEICLGNILLKEEKNSLNLNYNNCSTHYD